VSINVICAEGRGQEPATPTPAPVIPTQQPPVQPTVEPTQQPPAQAGAYYVAPNGNDNAAGTINAPFASIQHAVDLAGAGDVVYVRAGTYVEEVKIRNSGQPGNPLTVSAYPGEQVVIDGRYELPQPPASGWPKCNDTVSPPRCTHYKPMVSIEGDHIVFAGFHVTQSNGRGVRVWRSGGRPQGIVIQDNAISENRNAALIILESDGVTVENNEVWHNANYATHDRSPSVLNWPHAINGNHSTNLTYRGNTVYENYGEGIGSGRGSVGVVIEDNVIYDNKVQIYVHRTQDVVVQRNLVYCTNRPEFYRGGDPAPGVVVNNEYNFPDDIVVKNADIVNNIMTGCRLNFGMWGGGGSNKIGSEDVLFAYNTVINAVNNPGDDDVAIGINISEAPHKDIVIENNIVMQSTGKSITVGNSADVSFANNYWSQTPPQRAEGAGDIIGDPMLVNPNASIVPGAVQAEWYTLKSASGAVDQAMDIQGISDDFFGNARENQADIGFHELTNK
ncbi:MAG: DUF1565 domain-containing protein, partial [Chloroflexi bacterium]|nr:DUF1565 domain-containing protein [Chloroflexota bacterium]